MKVKFIPVMRCDAIDGMGTKCSYYAGEAYCGKVKMHICTYYDGSLHHGADDIISLFLDCPLSDMECDEE